ncbi:MAG: mannose-1-phosphate guanylyltransferase/mannose-6-phosphate isomerase [Deltaproteobacteria bacterium RBG_13_52_11]|nr:MAG: mannose-1-phosphate guanylyltransferase/mannose-6-phosphate isomerase [Deltaproteobacteria bacterium RBG_13_52_11]
MICAVILAGGKGTRFWPLSRENCPKQMLNIVGEDSLLRQTIKRLDGFIPLDKVWVVTTDILSQDIRFHLKPLGNDAERIRFIIEPLGKNTAPAIALAAITLNKLSSDPVMVVMPSDHIIRDTKQFQAKLQSAVEAAEKGYLVTFGIVPTRPETAYGYIRSGRPFKDSSDGIFHAEGFFEKPDGKTAETFLRQGGYYWNSGIFVWKASKILKEITSHLPSLYRGLQKIGELNDVRNEAFKELYASLESISIDHGVMEKSQDVLVIPADFGWCDLGNWTALSDVLERDEQGNILQGNAIDIGSENCTVIACDRVLATIGLKDMVVIDTADATLVSSNKMVHEVRKVVETLRRNNREEHLVHRTVERPWGSYTVLEKGKRYKIKRIVLHPKARLSLQLHQHRSEHWVVVSGTARVTKGEEVFDVHSNESTFIPIAVKHRLENPGRIPLQIIEVQNGDYVEENDIERLEDDYQRMKKG